MMNSVIKFAVCLNMISEYKYVQWIIVQKQHDTCIARRTEDLRASSWDNLTSLLLCCDIQSSMSRALIHLNLMCFWLGQWAGALIKALVFHNQGLGFCY